MAEMCAKYFYGLSFEENPISQEPVICSAGHGLLYFTTHGVRMTSWRYRCAGMAIRKEDLGET